METTSRALKEWAVTVQALAEGKQVLLLRKGGIHEKSFPVEHREFLLYPTYEHQRADLLKSAYHPDLQRVLAERGAPDMVRITLWARVTDVFEVRSQDKVEALSPHYIWTTDYASERLHWRPIQPLRVLLVRAYRLARPVQLPVLPQYGGCVSWLELATPVELAGLEPVLTDEGYRDLCDPIREVLLEPVGA